MNMRKLELKPYHTW